MKNKNIFTLVFFYFLAVYVVNSQNLKYDIIRITETNSVFRNNKIVKQVNIDLRDSTITTRKRPNKKFKPLNETVDISFFIDSVNYKRLKEIAQSPFIDPICVYHNEYGNYKIELITREQNGFSEMYSESIIINMPYRCSNKSDEELIIKTYTAIVNIMNAKKTTNK